MRSSQRYVTTWRLSNLNFVVIVLVSLTTLRWGWTEWSRDSRSCYDRSYPVIFECGSSIVDYQDSSVDDTNWCNVGASTQVWGQPRATSKHDTTRLATSFNSLQAFDLTFSICCVPLIQSHSCTFESSSISHFAWMTSEKQYEHHLWGNSELCS